MSFLVRRSTANALPRQAVMYTVLVVNGLVLRKRNCEAANFTVEHVSKISCYKVQGLCWNAAN